MKLGEMLQRAGIINELQLKTALAEQQRWGGKLGKILVDMNYLTEDLLIKALCKQQGLPRADLDHLSVPAQLLERVDRTFCERFLCVPAQYNHADRSLMVALADTTNLQALDELRFRTKLRIVPALAGEKAVAMAIARLYHSEALTDGPSEELKLMGNSGSTLVRRISDIVPNGAPPPVASAPPRPAAPPPAPPPAMPAVPPSMALPQPPAVPSFLPGVPPQLLEDLDRSQKRQTKAIRVLAELLVERGVFSREEYVAQLKVRS